MRSFIHFFVETFRDKTGHFSGREVTTCVFVLMIIVSWFGDQFMGYKATEYIFLSLIGAVTASFGFYTFEKAKKDVTVN